MTNAQCVELAGIKVVKAHLRLPGEQPLYDDGRHVYLMPESFVIIAEGETLKACWRDRRIWIPSNAEDATWRVCTPRLHASECHPDPRGI
jgi:hypothetical protein